MKRILSGVQATGELHLGNYLGALKPWAELQHDGEAFYFIPNLHSLNVRPKPDQLRESVYDTAAWLLAAGIDPAKSRVFVQSQVPAHSELSWILSNFVTMGELERMTQYKDKRARFGEAGQLVALFTYPVLMAADILLYDAELVPTGKDQIQHVEITRDIAERFNRLYGPVFTIPETWTPKTAAAIMNLQKPDRKMSKSDPDENGKIDLLENGASAQKKIMRAVTDSGSEIKSGPDKPALTNLLHIYAGLSGKTMAELENQYVGKSYGDFKTDLAALVGESLEALQKKYHEIKVDQAYIERVLEEGRVAANDLANAKLTVVKTALGLI